MRYGPDTLHVPLPAACHGGCRFPARGPRRTHPPGAPPSLRFDLCIIRLSVLLFFFPREILSKIKKITTNAFSCHFFHTSLFRVLLIYLFYHAAHARAGVSGSTRDDASFVRRPASKVRGQCPAARPRRAPLPLRFIKVVCLFCCLLYWSSPHSFHRFYTK